MPVNTWPQRIAAAAILWVAAGCGLLAATYAHQPREATWHPAIENRTPQGENRTPRAMLDAITVASTAPRAATPSACQPPICYPVHGPAAHGTWDDRTLPFTLEDLQHAAQIAGFTPGETSILVRLVSTCENIVMDAGIVNREAGPHPTDWAYGAAQVQLGWFDAAGLPRESWPSLVANIRAARAAYLEGLRVGVGPFGYWSCR